MKTNSVPKIRFKGFTDDWEQRKLGEIAEFNPKSDLPDEFEYVDLESVVGTEMVFHRTENKASAPSRAQRVAKTGDVFFQTVRPYQRNNYLFSMPYENYVFSTGYAQMRPKINAAFLMCFLQTESFVQNVLDNCTGTSYPAINSSDLSNLKISLPILKSEQSKIGELISNLDHLITLHQRKCEQTKELKKFMLQKMFPKKGEKNPEIRFPGFTDDWEQRKLEKHIIEYHEVTTENNQYPVLTSSRKGIFLQTDYYSGNQVASADNTGYNIVPYGYFTYRHMSDDEIFHFNINDIVENGIVSTLYPVFTTDEKLDSRYLQYQLNYGSEFARFAVLQKQGGSRTYMYLNKLKKLSLTMPTSIDEQKKISSFLMSLDNLITLHQRKCEQLKELKKFMLQNMFPKKG
ncbi:hypothetical protein Si081_00425 [Streptococcus infantarius subsp. infantarius]|nr:hypothetical protein [Streptococcus infantarius subsp. infantarius]